MGANDFDFGKLDFSDMVFDEVAHAYFLNGKQLPSVTQLLKLVTSGMFDNIPEEVLEHKRQIGVAVHKACELLDMDDLDEGSLSPSLIPFVDAYKLFKAQNKVEILLNEQKMCHKTLAYAGTVDRVAIINRDSKKTIIDLKTSASLSDWVGLQLAGYSMALGSHTGEQYKRCALQLRPDGTYRYREYSDPMDLPVFQSLLNVHNWMLNHK